MAKEGPARKAELLHSITLRGRVAYAEGDSTTLQTDGALLTIKQADIRSSQDAPNGEKEFVVAADAKIVFEALVNPAEAGGILSKEAVVQIVGPALRASGECECSRCTGGECECSRCTNARFGSGLSEFGTFRRVLTR